MVVLYLTIFICADNSISLLGRRADSSGRILCPDSELVFAALLQLGHSECRLHNIHVVGLHPDLRRQVTLLNDVASQSVAAVELWLGPLEGHGASGDADHVRFSRGI